MTLEDFKLFTNKTLNYSDEGWSVLVAIATERLASFLCLEELPDLDENPSLKMLLANFIALGVARQGDSGTVESKRIRNFTIDFKENTADAFSELYKQYGDIIEKYSECGLSFSVEKNARRCCRYGYNDF